MFILARFTRFKAGEYGTYFDKTYANTVLSNLDWNIVYIVYVNDLFVLYVFFQKQNYQKTPDIWDIWKPYQIPLFSRSTNVNPT